MPRHRTVVTLLLLLALAGSGCQIVIGPAAPAAPPTATSAPPTATPAATAPAVTPTASPAPAARASGPSRRDVRALGASRGPEGHTGGVSRVRVTVEPNPEREQRVGFYEEEVGGSGPMWRAAGWMAVIMSGFVLGIDPTDYRYTYEITGMGDGPSAGALVTVATLAGLLGHTPRADASLTGTINPDGTIGPVGGIPHKIEGAAKAGLKLVLIPAGQQKARDDNRKQSVDVVALGKQVGVEVREVADIFAAYEALTGQPLPRATVAAGPLTLPAAATDRVRDRLKTWLTRHDETRQQYQALPARARFESVQRMIDHAAALATRAREHEREGQVGAGYAQALNAAGEAAVALQTARVLHAYESGDLATATNRLRSLKPSLKIDALLERLESARAGTLGDVTVLASAFSQLGLGMGLTALGDAIASVEVGRQDDALAKLTAGTLMYVQAAHLVETSRDALDLGLGLGDAPAPERAAVERLSELFRRAAEANLNYFDTVVLAEIAQAHGVHLDVVRSRFAYYDMTYLFSSAAARATPLLERRTRQQAAAVYATLGGGLSSYVLSSTLVAKYYSLGAVVGRDGAVTEVGDEAALGRMLDFAERRARDQVGLGAASAPPIQSLLSLESAVSQRGGTPRERVDALADFWSATLQAQVLGILSGRARLLP